MFVCRKNLALSNEELKGWLIQLLGLYQKLTTDREIQDWNETGLKTSWKGLNINKFWFNTVISGSEMIKALYISKFWI